MANSTTNLDLLSEAQAGKATSANELFDAMSPASVFGRRATTTAGLTWGFYGGVIDDGGTPAQIANGTVTLSNNATNFLEFDANASPSGVQLNTVGWTGGTAVRLYKVVTSGGAVTSYEDWRPSAISAGGGSAPSTQPYDATTFFPGTPGASAILLRVPVARAVAFADDFAGSYGRASAAATGSTAFDVQVNGGSVGTITYGAGSSTATFVTAGGAVNLVAGDVLSIIAPVTPDATLANVGIVLAGTRSFT